MPNYVLDETSFPILEEADVNGTDFILEEANTSNTPTAPTGLVVITHV